MIINDIYFISKSAKFEIFATNVFDGMGEIVPAGTDKYWFCIYALRLLKQANKNNRPDLVKNKLDSSFNAAFKALDWYPFALSRFDHILLQKDAATLALSRARNAATRLFNEYEKTGCIKTRTKAGTSNTEEKTVLEKDERESLTKEAKEALTKRITSGITNLMKFFSEFDFDGSFRFINTFCHMPTTQAKKTYVENYFQLQGHPDTEGVQEKIKSMEFTNLCEELEVPENMLKPSINTRFSVYYGPQGGGKSTLATSKSNVIIGCNSAMTPDTILENFDFCEDGKATFKPSALRTAMETGTTIVLDEINLLPFETLRFLQTILDGKTSITYKDETIKIKDGFHVIGTMNLELQGVVYGLPAPLVDRAGEIRKMVPSVKDLVQSII